MIDGGRCYALGRRIQINTASPMTKPTPPPIADPKVNRPKQPPTPMPMGTPSITIIAGTTFDIAGSLLRYGVLRDPASARPA